MATSLVAGLINEVNQRRGRLVLERVTSM